MISKRFVPAQLLLPLLLISILVAPSRVGAEKPALAQDQGYVALEQELGRLGSTARLMHTTAHPDDEDGGMLTFESRGKGATALLFTLTRGQGGQNKSGDAFSDELGVLRTLELLAADEYYGVEQRFTRVADFGFSKTPEETFEKWGGHDVAMGDMVRVIRTFRPDVLVARFTGTTRDGHAHHQASSIVTQEAFKAAGDPNRFPEQIREGLLPWQPKKLYIGHFGASEDSNIKFDIGAYSPLLGMSFTQFAVEGLARQTSQGTGGFRVSPGHRYTYYTRVDSTLPKQELKTEESDFFDGIDTSLPGLASRLGSDENKVQFLRPALQQMAKDVEQAAQTAKPTDPSEAGAPLVEGLKIARDVIQEIDGSPLAPAEKLELLTNLRTKEQQFERAADLALGVLLDVSVDPPEGAQGGFFRLEQTFQTAVPGQTFMATAHFYDRGTQDVEPEQIALDMPEGFKSEVVKAKFIDPVSGQGQHELAVAPALSIEFDDPSQLVRIDSGKPFSVGVRVRSQLTTSADATLRFSPPPGWTVSPSSRPVHLEHEGDVAELQFAVQPKLDREAHYDLNAIADYKGKELNEGFNVVTRNDLDRFYYYRPATLDVSAVRVNLPPGLRVGYVMGAGDEIPAALKQLGIDVQVIYPANLASADLSRFHTIVMGIRAYDVSTDVRVNNSRLLDFVQQGGTLILQYNSGTGAFNAGHYTPYPATASNARVSVEEAPVEILDAQSPILNYPNKITAHDFDGWVQERGLYFMSNWDDHFHPLLASNDPGEQPQKGGLLVAQYGKGTYIYSGYAFFRQLPAGVPGAIRLFVNLLTAGTRVNTKVNGG